MKLFRCLIRDVEPRKSDMHCAVANLAPIHPQAIVAQHLAIFLPKDRIRRLGHDLGQALWRASP